MQRFLRIMPLLAVLVLPLATACAQAPQTRPNQPAADDQIMCMALFDPVCGTKDGKQVTYGNDCEARRAGATNVTKGACAPAR